MGVYLFFLLSATNLHFFLGVFLHFITGADIQIAYELQGKVKERTPRKTGRLQDSWKVGPIVKKGDTYYIEVYNNVEYAEPVEYGHRTRGGRGFVPGKHMMELSLEELNQALPGFLREWLSDFISTHDL